LYHIVLRIVLSAAPLVAICLGVGFYISEPLLVIAIAAGLAMLCFGGNWLVGGGISIAKKFKMSPMIIGITIVAMGTSSPELAASLAAGENGEIILGNVVGSNIANMGMVIGIAAIMTTLVLDKSRLKKDLPIMIGFSFLLVALSVDGEVSQVDGAILVSIMIAFTIYAYKSSRSASIGEPEVGGTPFKAAGLISVGIVLLAIGAVLTIDNAVQLAKIFGLSDRYIGLTVIAIGTSLPELVTSIIAIRKGQTDIGIGNIIGSNIYNILMIAGIASLLSGIVTAPQIMTDYAIMIAFSLALLAGLSTGKLDRRIGIVLTGAYVAYMVLSFYI